ncbi:hypothetical protein [Legionella jordanis]|uniref:Rap1a immunity protein domain-containing protein n=1 Tax=Legionella jordanis TaxID=456 RepID=A0A0W0VE65_9GAMM|nr:hypothetical protein [Legionella jordanis]KTD17913.1 hypothetical protein Ljor_2219 [Legionella jordanis]RMX02388.1 hypothetical protein EAW55_09060 [Legionella jordanis]RMX21770.1 hypothetical protein EAS68_03165 [Legionella jordanis]VEH13996.1 Uncharacterised protein [Legionella jordanis]
MKPKLIALLMALPVMASAGLHANLNFKKTFCGNEDFLGNAGAKRPHLHCGTSFISYKKQTGDHSNISEPGNCVRTNAVFDHIKANINSFENYSAIYNALVLYHQAGCPNQ